MRRRIIALLCALAAILATLGTAAGSMPAADPPAAKDSADVSTELTRAAPLIPAAVGLFAVNPANPAFAVGLSSGISHQLIPPAKQLVKAENPRVEQRKSLAAAGLTEVSRSGSRPVIPYTPEDLDLLARLITVEAGNQPYETQVAVGAVVLNRVQSGAFPDSLREVIFQPGQFPPATNGRINRRAATAKAVKAAEEALAGADPTNGALYFTSASAAGAFFKSRSGRMVLGDMLFTF
ncbi:MAG: cell wall hydrolase [Thermoanaerobacterales bacterium]|nr:cell wall hydrolase [Bacillota bacterium]MDI6907775.1 cell wall hydrolase [Thermoanaerobacterales bacterium]